MTSSVVYVVLRRDLIGPSLKWPLGALSAQVGHVCMAMLWENREDDVVHSYMADVGRMRKVVLEVCVCCSY